MSERIIYDARVARVLAFKRELKFNKRKRTAMDNIKVETIEETQARCHANGATWLGDRVEFGVNGVDVPRDVAIKVFEEHGFASLVQRAPKPDSALKAASRRGRNPRGFLVREFVHPNADTPLAIHVTEVTGDDESGDEYTCLARVRIGQLGLDKDGNTVLKARAFPPEGQSEFPCDDAMLRAEDIAEHANHLLENMDASQLGKALRAAVEQAGGSKSLGGGNNYYVIAHNAPAVHDFMSECAERLGVYYLRDPKTTMGASHDRAVMQDAGKRKLGEELADMKARLTREIEESKSPSLTSKGKPKSREGYLKRQLENMQELGRKLALYKEVIEASVMAPLQETQELYQQHFRRLLEGQPIDFVDEEDADTHDDGSTQAMVPPSSVEELPPPTSVSLVEDDDEFEWANA